MEIPPFTMFTAEWCAHHSARRASVERNLKLNRNIFYIITVGFRGQE